MKMKVLLFILLGVGVMSGCTNKLECQNPKPGQYPHVMARAVTMKLDYLLYLPKDYKEQKSWPLLVFLHGAGERGSDLNRVKAYGPPRLVQDGKDLPFIIVSPQCPANKWWPYLTDPVMALIDEISDSYSVDQNRIYLTGLSMGGFGTWAIAGTYPERFAAIAPICGGGHPYAAESLKNVPVWAFHGDKDSIIPLQRSQEMVDTVNRIGGDAKLTIYPGLDHNSWDVTYNNNELYEWLLSHSKKQD